MPIKNQANVLPKEEKYLIDILIEVIDILELYRI